jgi:surface antigen
VNADYGLGHNCTRYVAFRLAEEGVAPSKSWGNAYQWGNGHPANPLPPGTQENQTPAIGSVAYWNSGTTVGGAYGHVGVVDWIGSDSGGQYILVSNDNFPVTGQAGYTAVMKIYMTSPYRPTAYLHFVAGH